MRLITLLGLLLSANLLFAQIPDGSIAPEFSTTTLDGTTFNLYDELDAGFPVLMDISATWCGPCWSYHNTHAFRDTWEDHGPDGDNTLRMIMIEGDGSTNTNCLYGSSGCNSSTQGNWTAGTPYPIADDALVSDLYGVNAFPTILLVCPDRTVLEVGQSGASVLASRAAACPRATGDNNASIAIFETGGAAELCTTAEITPTIRLQNMGAQNMTSATITLIYDGELLETLNWTGDLETYAFEAVSFSTTQIDKIGKLEVEITSVNGTTDDDLSKNKSSLSIVDAPKASKPKTTIEVKTGEVGRDIYWECRKLDGTVIKSGGNTTVGPNGGGQYTNVPSGPGAYGNNSTNKVEVVLPEDGCYYFHIVSARGKGMDGGSFKIFDGVASNFVPAMLIIEPFTAYRDAHYGTSSTFVNIQDVVLNAEVQVYPNPASSTIQVSFGLERTAELSFDIINELGQVVQNQAQQSYPAGDQMVELPVSNLTNGMYFLQMKNQEGTISKTFTVQK